ncbi:Uncharacterised protein [Mycobacterium tuberculosis]|nr:Uncharacterised protein [Mycobacterium tuberculosis]CPA80108.1 Uncharacterised protein [Mycobacterium tuberculosis]CPA87770.1 Uncharacterised protein [Mycobacterium tuberculosis]
MVIDQEDLYHQGTTPKIRSLQVGTAYRKYGASGLVCTAQFVRGV